MLLTCDEETVQELVARYRETREDLRAEINWLENEIEVVKRKQKALLERFTRGYGFSAEGLDREAHLLKGKLFKLEEELSIAKSKLEMSADEILALGQRFLQAERAEQNRILRRVFSGAVYITRKNKLRQNISELIIRTSNLVRNLEITVARTMRFYPFQYFTDTNDAEILRQHGPVIAAGGWDGTELPDDVKRVVTNMMESQNNTLTGIIKIETKDGTGDAPQIRGILRAQTSDGKCILKYVRGKEVDALQLELIKPVTGRKAKLLAELDKIAKKRSSGSGSSTVKLKKVNCGDTLWLKFAGSVIFLGDAYGGVIFPAPPKKGGLHLTWQDFPAAQLESSPTIEQP